MIYNTTALRLKASNIIISVLFLRCCSTKISPCSFNRNLIRSIIQHGIALWDGTLAVTWRMKRSISSTSTWVRWPFFSSNRAEVTSVIYESLDIGSKTGLWCTDGLSHFQTHTYMPTYTCTHTHTTNAYILSHIHNHDFSYRGCA